MRKRGVKDDIFDPNNWENGTVVNWKEEDSQDYPFPAGWNLCEPTSITQTGEGSWVPEWQQGAQLPDDLECESLDHDCLS